MNKKQLYRFNSKLHNKLKKQAKAILVDVDVEGLHKLRVAYKKLRAFLRMLSLQKKATVSIKISNKLKACFKKAGSIRDILLQQQNLLKAVKDKEIKKPASYLTLLQKESDQLKKELQKIVSIKAVTSNYKKTSALLPDKLSIKKFRNFLQQQWAIIDAIILSGSLSDENFHSIRKSLKDIFLNLNIYEKTKHGMLTNSIWRGKDTAYYTALLKELGNLHDIFTGISLLRIKLIKDLNKQNLAQLDKIKKVWQKQKATIKKTLITRLKTELLK